MSEVLHAALRGAIAAAAMTGMRAFTVNLGLELVLAPLMGLRHATQAPPVQRIAIAADHALYGFVLSEMRRRPQG